MVLLQDFQRLLGRLSVGRKLMLIYVLDLSAVIFVSSILVREKFIAIDFARKELQGSAYIAGVRQTLVDAALVGAGQTARLQALPAQIDTVLAVQVAHGGEMDSQALQEKLVARLRPMVESAGLLPEIVPEIVPGNAPGNAPAAVSATVPAPAIATASTSKPKPKPASAPPAGGAAQPPTQRLQAAALVAPVLASGAELITRVGNQSNLILDPMLDSYYTMSLIVLRYPELLQVVQDIGERLQQAAHGGNLSAADLRSRYLVLEGRFDASVQGITSDHAEAYAAGGPALSARLSERESALQAALEDFRAAARAMVDAVGSQSAVAAFDAANAAQRALLVETGHAWASAGDGLDDLLLARIDALYTRMWWHLGTALALLLAVLVVVTLVARSIARPLRHLSGVAEAVRHSGNHTLRAVGEGSDETARLVVAFNDMLDQLGREREAQKELAASARAAEAERALVEATPIALVVTAIPGHAVLHANPPAARWLAGDGRDPWQRGMDASVRARFFQQLADVGEVDEFEVRWQAGSERTWVGLSARRVLFQGQDAVLTAFSPINHLKLMERRLELWAKVFETSGEAILIVDAERRILTANQAFSRHTGYELQDVIGEPPSLLLPGIEPAAVASGLWNAVLLRGLWHGELPLRRRDGSEYPAWVMVSAVRQQAEAGGEISHYIFTSIDISDRKKSEQRIRFLAEHDVLTELPNRSLCTERLRLALQQAERSGRQVAVLFIDLDRFKDINDNLGHHIGDSLLRSVAQRLQDAVRAGDTVSRLGGDEFVIVLNGVQDTDEVAHIVEQRLIPRIRQPHRVGGTELHVSCSVGIAIYPDDATDIDTLMRHADTAMYQAKAGGKDGAQFFTAEMTARAQARMQLEGALRHALERAQLRLHWQPRVRASDGVLAGVEGLLRWGHPDLGMVAPGEFIALAEETGLIVPIGAWVIDSACRQLADWRAQGLPPMGVSINLSARQLRDEGLLAVVEQALRRHAVPAGMLELELTESMVMEDAERNLRQMHALRALGVSLAIDDFGTGYSSLAYLNRFPIDKLKIDRSFVHGMLKNGTDRAITMAVIGLGHTLGLKVVAEGVEQPGEAALLREAHCDELQGFLYGAPMAGDALAAWATARRKLPLAA